MSIKPIVLYGAGGMGREVLQIIDGINYEKPTYEFLGFVVGTAYYTPGQTVNGYPIIGDHADTVACTCAVGDPHIRALVQERLEAAGVEMITLVATDVYIPPTTTIGAGSVIYCDSRVSVNCALGKGVVLNCGVTLGHDDVIGSYSCIMPGTGISGNCTVGEQVFIGGHAFIIPDKRIGDGATVAAGSIVFSNVRPRTTVLGNPAKRVRALETE